MTIQFKYKPIAGPDGKERKRPCIPVTIMGPSESTDVIALLDSGADSTAIPRSMGEILGFDLTGETKDGTGIGSKFKMVERNTHILVEKDHEKYSIQVPMAIIVGFGEKLIQRN